MTKFVTAVVLALALLAPTSASAAKAPKPVRDCTADGRIDGRYSKSELRRAIKAVPKSSKGKECKKRLNRVLKRGGDGRLKSSGSYKAVLRDCADNGWIDKRFSVATLKKALKKLPADLEDYSDCGPTLRSEIKARTKKSKR
jgi:hypothetical protein